MIMEYWDISYTLCEGVWAAGRANIWFGWWNDQWRWTHTDYVTL